MFLIFLIGTFAAASVSIILQRFLEAPEWTSYVISGILGLILYTINCLLTQKFISKKVGFDTSVAFGNT